MARWLVEKDGIFIGSSSAVNCKLYNKLSLSNAHEFRKVLLPFKQL
jgi:cysteine synthase